MIYSAHQNIMARTSAIPWLATAGIMICFIMMLLPARVDAANVKLATGTDEQAKLPFWEISNEFMSLRLVHRLPDQTRGFFEARGFTPAQADVVARACVFQTVFKNTSKGDKASTLEYNLTEWAVMHGKRPRPMKMREQWAPELEKLGVSKPARLAFEWSLLPSQQTYQPGDYNWGMSVYNLKPGTQFSLRVSWKQHGTLHQYTIDDMHCAADIRLDPVAE